MKFCLLASGSKGNAIYLEHQGGAVLVDCGISCRQVLLRLQARGLQPARIQAIVLTHEHTDHVRGVAVLSRRLGGVPVLATQGTWEGMGTRNGLSFSPIQAGEPFEVGRMSFQPFSLPHDAADPIGLVASAGGAKLGLATDLGQATRLVHARLAGCQALVLEHNHDPQMLAQGPYPHRLKQRISSRQGHLSNQQGAELLEQLQHGDLRQVVLAHLSETNNTARLAHQAADQVLRRLGCHAQLNVARQSRPGPVLEI